MTVRYRFVVLTACLTGCLAGGEQNEGLADDAGMDLRSENRDGDDMMQQHVMIADPVLHERYDLELPYSNDALHVGMFVNAAGERQVVAIDQSGSAVDLEAARSAEEDALRERCGALESSLCDDLSKNESSPTNVAIWLRVPMPGLDFRLLEHDPEAFEGSREDWLGDLRTTIEPLVSEMKLVALGAKLELDSVAPVIYAQQVPADQLRALSRLAFVDRIYTTAGNGVEALADSITTANWAINTTSDGTGIKVAFLELDNVASAINLPALTTRLPSDATSTHAQGVIGTMANTRSADSGYAAAIRPYLANNAANEDWNAAGDIRWGLDQGVTMFNGSSSVSNARVRSGLQNRDRYTDYVTRFSRKLFVLAAMNVVYAQGNADTDYVSNKAFNALIVGGTYENGTIMNGVTPATESCTAQRMSSAFRNDANNQELPHLTAVGSCVGLWGNTFYTGTSFATPGVAGIAAGLMELNTALQTWPEGMKAILLASPQGPGTSSPDGCEWRQVKNAQGVCSAGDGRDGTGLVNGFWARRIADRTKKLRGAAASSWGHDYGTMRQSAFSASTLEWSSSWNAKAGTSCTDVNRRMRVALAWDTNPVCDANTRQCTSDGLRMNLDLRVYRMPDNVLVGRSETTTNSYEHVDIPVREQRGACSPAGTNYTYKIVVRLANRASVGATEETPFGLAWHTYLPR